MLLVHRFSQIVNNIAKKPSAASVYFTNSVIMNTISNI